MGFLSRFRRKKVAAAPFPERWLAIIEERVPLYRRLPAADREELKKHIQIFLSEKKFEGCEGVTVTEEMKVVVAANACLLLLHRKTDYFPVLSSIVMYPKSFTGRRRDLDEAGVVHEFDEERLGESWGLGTVVLSWGDILDDARYCDDMNVIIHEFAHQLDEENGADDGVPLLTYPGEQREWERVLGAEFERLREEDDRGIETFLDPYGAESPAEFFAVVTEAFFLIPWELSAEHSELYARLAAYYKQDPASSWERYDCPGTAITCTVES